MVRWRWVLRGREACWSLEGRTRSKKAQLCVGSTKRPSRKYIAWVKFKRIDKMVKERSFFFPSLASKGLAFICLRDGKSEAEKGEQFEPNHHSLPSSSLLPPFLSSFLSVSDRVAC